MTTYGVLELNEDVEWTEVEAFDESSAAESYVEDVSFAGGYSFASIVEIEVKSPDGTVSRWDVEVEMEPTFRARRAQ